MGPDQEMIVARAEQVVLQPTDVGWDSRLTSKLLVIDRLIRVTMTFT